MCLTCYVSKMCIIVSLKISYILHWRYIRCVSSKYVVESLFFFSIVVNCIRGTYYDNTNELCGVCPIGQYTDQERQTTCKSCALGYTTESSGTTSSTLCYSKFTYYMYM